MLWNYSYSIWESFDKIIFKIIFWSCIVWFNINWFTFYRLRTNFWLQRSWCSWFPVALFWTGSRICLRGSFCSITWRFFVLRLGWNFKSRLLLSIKSQGHNWWHFNFTVAYFMKFALGTLSSRIEEPISVPSLCSFFTIFKNWFRSKKYILATYSSRTIIIQYSFLLCVDHFSNA